MTHHGAMTLVVLLAGLSGGCEEESSPTPPADATPPERVIDLAATELRGHGVSLTWTAPGDDGTHGQAQMYDVRYAQGPLTESTWDSASAVQDPPVPQPAGSSESFMVTGLEDGTWYFALRTADEVPNWSELSNVASSSLLPDSLPPNAIMDLYATASSWSSFRLEWTAPADDREGIASTYDLRYSDTKMSDETWDAATPVSGLPAPSEPGTSDSAVVGGLDGETTYFFAIRSADSVPNWSDLSNVAVATTPADEIPPAAVTDLAVVFHTPTTISLRWTSPGDDGDVGTPTAVDVRYASAPITEDTWKDATSFGSQPEPGEAGTTMSFRAVGLSSKETFYVALRTADERPNWSAISNAVSVELAPVLRLTSSPEGTSATSPAWSPDGSHLAVHADWINPLHDQIFVVDLVAGEWERVTRDADFAWYPSWSPDGTRIAYMTHRHEGGPYGDDSDTGLWVQEPDLLAPRTLLARHGNGDFVRSSSWSPDGSEIAYAITLGLPPTVAGVFVVPSSGGSVRVLTNEGSGNGGPSWSPDGLSIAFHSDRSGNDEIYEVPANGGEPVPMTSDPAGDMHPAYSPDGTQIAFASDRGGSLDLWLMSTSGGGAIQLTAGDAVDTTPKWSPSGEEIAFRSNRSGGYEVWLLDVAAAVAAPR